MQTLELTPRALIGKGLHRECYVHPGNSQLCVKIVVAGESDENRREADYYHRLSRRLASWEKLPRFHGLVDTNLGEGAVFDHVRDSSGCSSRTLRYYLESAHISQACAGYIAAELRALHLYLLENRIITMNLKVGNILYQLREYGECGEGRAVLVDGLGNTDFIPLTNYNAFLARRKISRKWERFENFLTERYPGNAIVEQLLRS